ncbi:MAG TPA: heterodisulfide reductase-related iron-sulfur binding cluster, partial [Acidimicrobiales bacterium]
FDEADLRQEMNRVYDLCHGCRLCFKFCTAFPTLFAAIDQHDDQDSARMTPAEQDQVVDECFNCKLCYVNCPYIPGQHEWELDFPRLMLRAEQVLHRERRRPVATRLTDQALGRTDLAGKVNTALAPVVNRVVDKPGGAGRKLMEKVAGIASERVLPPYARQRFSTWWRRRRRDGAGGVEPARQGSAIVFPTCIVEYQTPQVGKDLVRVYERNGIECSVPDGQVCCGAPWLHSGDVESFRKQGRKNVAVLAGAIREAQARGDEAALVVPQPTCGYVLKYDYKDYIGGADAELVAQHTYDTSEYLMKVHKGEGTELDRSFTGEVPAQVTYHAPCHLRAQNIGLKSRDLVKLTGAKIKVVAECSGIDGTWGYRKDNYAASRQVARKMGAAIDKAGGDVVVGDCHLANGGIVQETGRTPQHPLSTIARAYGIPED